MSLSLWYSNSTPNALLQDEKRYQKEKKSLILHGWEVENMKYENENYYLLWSSHFRYNCLGLSDEDNSVSRTDNFVNLNVFNSVISPRDSLTVAFCSVS